MQQLCHKLELYTNNWADCSSKKNICKYDWGVTEAEWFWDVLQSAHLLCTDPASPLASLCRAVWSGAESMSTSPHIMISASQWGFPLITILLVWHQLHFNQSFTFILIRLKSFSQTNNIKHFLVWSDTTATPFCIECLCCTGDSHKVRGWSQPGRKTINRRINKIIYCKRLHFIAYKYVIVVVTTALQ